MTSSMTIEQLIENFELLGDWDDRFNYIMELGEKLPPLPDEDKIEENLVQGCESQVWVKASFPGGAFDFNADGDAHMARGMLSLIRTLYQGKTPQEVLDIDMQGFVTRTGLMDQLSPKRQHGLQALLGKIHGLANAALADAG